ncbi:hypothetical protein [Psychrobacillus sp. L3]|uniref:hypothetical protein n=1 Tax=Psychrobacillus sp. L3 TaxID=3236891 RepID=UPI0036F286DC
MHCSNCGNVQDTGKFCSTCGYKLVQSRMDSQSVLADEFTLTRREVESNVHMQNMKQRLYVYRTYFTKQLKKPSLAYERGETELTSGIVSIILFIALFTISLFFLTKSLSLEIPLSFLPFFTKVFLLTLFLIGIPVISIFIANYVFGLQHTVKEIVGFYGGQLSPFLIGVAVSLLFIFGNLYMYGNVILSLCMIFSIFILPPYIIVFLITKKSTDVDPLYGLMIYILFFAVVFFIFLTIIADSPIVEYFQLLNYF